jgi:hypothetical protein
MLLVAECRSARTGVEPGKTAINSAPNAKRRGLGISIPKATGVTQIPSLECVLLFTSTSYFDERVFRFLTFENLPPFAEPD